MLDAAGSEAADAAAVAAAVVVDECTAELDLVVAVAAVAAVVGRVLDHSLMDKPKS